MSENSSHGAANPFEGYHVVSPSGVFLGYKAGLTDLQVRPANTAVDARTPEYRITGFPDGGAPLYVRSYYLLEDGATAIFRESVEELGTRPATIRYVIMVQRGSDWHLVGIVVGPANDTDQWARSGIEDAIRGMRA